MNQNKKLLACVESTIAGGKAIKNYKFKKEKLKQDEYVGHHAIVTSADYKSQEAILKTIHKFDKNSFFITEEHVSEEFFRKRLIGQDNLNLLNSCGVYIIDELCGTSSYNIGHYEHSISVGYIENLIHQAGAVYAPKLNTLYFASLGEGTFIKKRKEEQVEVSQKNLKESYVIFGVDCFLTKYPLHNKLVNIIADKARTINSNGSCSLPLSLVATGNADALVQPLQSPWDWAAGKLLVEEAGGQIIFYEMKNNNIIRIDKLREKHYNPNKRSLGFIAANSDLAENIFEKLFKLSKK